nr:hypothetical protein [Tanacetum cinerariifolium]
TSATREYPSLIHTFFLTHTVGGVFLNPKDKALYDEMLRLQGLGSKTPTRQGTVIPPPSQSTHSADIARLKKSEKWLTKQVNMFMRLFRSDDKFSQMLSQLESRPEYGGGSESGGYGDDVRTAARMRTIVRGCWITTVAGAGMMSREMMRTTARMGRMKTIVRRCWAPTPPQVPYTDDEIMIIIRRGKQRGHIPGVGRVFSRQGMVIPPSPPCTHSSDVAKLKKREKLLTKQVNMFMNDSGGCGDDEPGDDEDDGEDGEDEDDS